MSDPIQTSGIPYAPERYAYALTKPNPLINFFQNMPFSALFVNTQLDPRGTVPLDEGPLVADKVRGLTGLAGNVLVAIVYVDPKGLMWYTTGGNHLTPMKKPQYEHAAANGVVPISF